MENLLNVSSLANLHLNILEDGDCAMFYVDLQNEGLDFILVIIRVSHMKFGSLAL